MVARGWGRAHVRSCSLMATVSVEKDESILGMDGGDECPTM